jgi:hypothetical protein
MKRVIPENTKYGKYEFRYYGACAGTFDHRGGSAAGEWLA